MNYHIAPGAVLAAVALSFPLLANTRFVDCSHQSLAATIQGASAGDTITFTGTCHENVVIQLSGLTLAGLGPAVISSPNAANDVLTVNGAHRVTLGNFTVQNGNFGVHAKGGAAIVMQGVTVENNKQTGIFLEGNSTASISNCTSAGNGVDGIDAEDSSSIIFTGPFSAMKNAVFGVNLGATSSATLNSAMVSAMQNVLGIQVSLSSSMFLADPGSSINASNNITTGLTIVSGAHLFNFGGVITTLNNGINGISLFSRSGMDMDAASTVTSSGNQQDGVHLEELSTLNLFNTPAFSGAPGVTTLNVTGNVLNGISTLLNSQVHMFNQTTINSSGNHGVGIQVDNGSSLTLLSSTIKDNVTLTFGSRGEFTTDTISHLSCDATSLIRGLGAKACPQP